MFSEEPFGSSPFCSSFIVQAGFEERHLFVLYVKQSLELSTSVDQGLSKDLTIQQVEVKTLELSKRVSS